MQDEIAVRHLGVRGRVARAVLAGALLLLPACAGEEHFFGGPPTFDPPDRIREEISAAPGAGAAPARSQYIVFGPEGKIYRRVGNTTIGPDGTTFVRSGNTTLGSDGTSYRTFGNVTVGTDGSVCRRSDIC